MCVLTIYRGNARHSARFYALRTSGPETDFFHKLSCIYSLF